MKNIFRKTLAALLVPVIAVLSSEIFDIVQGELADLLASPGLHGNYYESPNRLGYIVASLIVGFLPAILLRRVIEPAFAAVIPALIITLHEILSLNPFMYFHAPNVTSDLLHYLLPWSIANYVGLIVWGPARRETH